MARIGLMPLARPTFDVPFAQEMAASAIAALEAAGHEIIGARALLFDTDAAIAALGALSATQIDLLLILQVTFTDASMTVTIADTARAPLAIWAFPEPRLGGRLRLNAFCGLNLAAHALGRAGKSFRWAYSAPDAASMPDVLDALFGQAERDVSFPMGPKPTVFEDHAAKLAIGKLQGARIGLIGAHPAGFDTCRYDAPALGKLLGASVGTIALPDFFDRARAVPAASVAAAKAETSRRITGLDGVDQPQLDRSMSVFRALQGVAEEGGYQALAVRCWPEMFTDYGCAACGPMGLMSEASIPCACEADVMGAVTSLVLQQVAGAPSFLADIVDMDEASNTGVLWHCGLAPMSMADDTTPPMAQIHSNRRMPLLQEFALKPGRVTVARLTQAKNKPALVLAGAEMVRASPSQPARSFTGTSGVIRFDRATGDVTSAMMEMGLEHHVSIVYGEHRGTLRALAAQLGLPVIDLA
jgi:L-fucose isomerase-like protein